MPIDNPTITEKSVSVDVDGGKPTGSRRSFTPVLLAMVFIAFAFGLAGAIVGAVQTERLNDLQSKVDALEAKSAHNHDDIHSLESKSAHNHDDIHSLEAKSAHNHDDIHSLEAKAAITEGLVVTRSAVPPAGYVFGQSFNAGTGEWAPAVHMPEERSDLQAVACGGKIVVLGGINAANVVQSTTWAFDPFAEVWATDLPPMPTGRTRFSAACLDGHVYVAGGYASFAHGDDGDNAHCLATVDRYDVAGKTWEKVANLTTPRGDMALAAAAGKLYAIGGYGPSWAAVAETEVFDPATGAWSAAAVMPHGGKGDIFAVEIDGVIYVPGGWNGKFKDELVAYDAAGNSWTTLAPMQTPRGDKAVAVLDGRLYVVGGEIYSGKQEPCSYDTSTMCDINKVPIHGVEQFTPATGAWVPVSLVPGTPTPYPFP